MTSKVVYQGNLRTLCTHTKSSNSIETDAPIDNNGKGELFSPTDIVATALAACMITVMGIKAHSSKVPFDNIESEVTKIMGSNPRRISEIVVRFIIGEEWNDKQKTIMENTAQTCPVAQSLSPDLVQTVVFDYK